MRQPSRQDSWHSADGEEHAQVTVEGVTARVVVPREWGLVSGPHLRGSPAPGPSFLLHPRKARPPRTGTVPPETVPSLTDRRRPGFEASFLSFASFVTTDEPPGLSEPYFSPLKKGDISSYPTHVTWLARD